MGRATAERFYQAFANRDGATMAACYAPDATFEDPAFSLRGAEIGAMWQMLTSRAKDFALRYRIVSADAERAVVEWEADYLFSATGRPVRNRIRAELRFRDGRIVEHRDDFDFHRWARMALGPIGLLLGWTPFLRNKVRQQAGEQLKRFMAGKGG
jgi:ketosteroid isomerase-like protein